MDFHKLIYFFIAILMVSSVKRYETRQDCGFVPIYIKQLFCFFANLLIMIAHSMKLINVFVC